MRTGLSHCQALDPGDSPGHRQQHPPGSLCRGQMAQQLTPDQCLRSVPQSLAFALGRRADVKCALWGKQALTERILSFSQKCRVVPLVR